MMFEAANLPTRQDETPEMITEKHHVLSGETRHPNQSTNAGESFQRPKIMMPRRKLDKH